MASGEQVTAAHDAEVFGVSPLIFRRVYSTSFLDRAPSVLGSGWVHSFEATLTRDLDGFVFEGHDGARVEFDDVSLEFDQRGSLFSSAAAMELRREGDRLVVYHWHEVHEAVQKYVFDARQGDRMRLLARELPSGQGLDIQRGASRPSRRRQNAADCIWGMTAPAGSKRCTWASLRSASKARARWRGIASPRGPASSDSNIRRWLCGGRTIYFWTGDDLLAEERAGCLTEYMMRRFVAHALWEDGKIRHIVNSQQGVPQELIDDQGVPLWMGTFDDWGKLIAEGHDDGSSALARSARG